MADCIRCGRPIEPHQRSVADPCCGAPDCDAIDTISHFNCLPAALRSVEERY